MIRSVCFRGRCAAGISIICSMRRETQCHMVNGGWLVVVVDVVVHCDWWYKYK